MTTPPPADMQPTSGKAIASMVVGIVSFLLCLYWFISIPGGIVAIVLGVLGRNETKAGTHKGGGMAMTGLILGAVTVLLAGAALVLGSLAPGLLEGICENNPDIPQCADL